MFCSAYGAAEINIIYRFLGVLVFFSSYSLMYSMITAFKSARIPGRTATIWDQMCAAKKLVVEPKSKVMIIFCLCLPKDTRRSNRVV